MTLLRPLVRLVGFVWSIVLALLALGIALYCIDGLIGLGASRPDRLLELSSVRRSVGRFLGQLEAPGSLAAVSMLCGLGAVVIGLTILWGLLGRPGQRVAVLAEDGSPAGVLAVRRGTLLQMVRSLLEERRELFAVKRVGIRLGRRGIGGRVRVDVLRAGNTAEADARRSIEQALLPLAEPLSLRQRIRVRSPRESGESPPGGGP